MSSLSDVRSTVCVFRLVISSWSFAMTVLWFLNSCVPHAVDFVLRYEAE